MGLLHLWEMSWAVNPAQYARGFDSSQTQCVVGRAVRRYTVTVDRPVQLRYDTLPCSVMASTKVFEALRLGSIPSRAIERS
jgi:hypothetical protein